MMDHGTREACMREVYEDVMALLEELGDMATNRGNTSLKRKIDEVIEAAKAEFGEANNDEAVTVSDRQKEE